MIQEDGLNGEGLVEEIRNELGEIDSLQINVHAQRFEELHTKLATALSSIDGL
ncbi:MAG: hypothetical protein RIQ73_454 [Actinomycetota bacterium]